MRRDEALSVVALADHFPKGDPNVKNEDGKTVMHRAVLQYLELIRREPDEAMRALEYVTKRLNHLKKQGGDFSQRDGDGNTPLATAILQKECSTELVETLVECGSPLDDLITVESTKVHLLTAAVLHDHPPKTTARFAVRKENIVTPVDLLDGMSVLVLSLTQRPKLAIALLKQMPELLQEKVGSKQSPLLHISTVSGDLELIGYLVEDCKVDREATTTDGLTALEFAEQHELPGAALLYSL